MSRFSVQLAALYTMCAAWSLPVQALPVTADYMRVMEGVYVLDSGLVVGGVKAELHFNINPIKLAIERVPGFDPNARLIYRSIPLFQDQFWIDVTYSFSAYAPAGFENRTISISGIPIKEFEVRNGVIDELIVRADGTVGQLPFELWFDAWTTDTSALSSTALMDILAGSTGRLLDCPGGPNDVCALFSPSPTGLPAGYGYIESIGASTEVYLAPTPGTLALVVPAILSLVAVRRNRGRIGRVAHGH